MASARDRFAELEQFPGRPTEEVESTDRRWKMYKYVIRDFIFVRDFFTVTQFFTLCLSQSTLVMTKSTGFSNKSMISGRISTRSTKKSRRRKKSMWVVENRRNFLYKIQAKIAFFFHLFRIKNTRFSANNKRGDKHRRRGPRESRTRRTTGWHKKICK